MATDDQHRKVLILLILTLEDGTEEGDFVANYRCRICSYPRGGRVLLCRRGTSTAPG